MNKKILHIITTMDPAAGGVSQAVRGLVEEWGSKGITNEVVSMDPDAVSFRDNFKLFKTGPGKTAWNYAPALHQWLGENLSTYDIVILHGLWQYSSLALLKNIRRKKGPAIYVMPHGMLDPYFQHAKGRKIKAARNWLFWKMVEGPLVAAVDGLLFTCETEKILARESFSPYHPKSEIVTGLAVDPAPAFADRMKTAFDMKRGTRLDKPYWLYLSRIHEKKGLDLLISAYLRVRADYPELPDLIIAGPGLETPYGNAMAALASGEPSIRFVGMIEGDAKWGAFYGCEVFVLPSHQENFGIAVVEALACGKQVLISDKVNIWREIIESGAGLMETDTAAGTEQLLRRYTEMPASGKEKMTGLALQCYKQYFEKGRQLEKIKAMFPVTAAENN